MKKTGEKEVVVKFNGAEISMVPFVEDMVRETLVGMMSALKGYEDGCDIEISIRSDNDI